MDDSGLAARAVAGDDVAFGELVDRHYRACWRYARRVLSTPDDAEDVIQETFFRAHRALARYQERSQFRSWLFQILVNECRMSNRGSGRRDRRIVLDEKVVMRAVSATSVQESSDDGLWSAMATLDEKSREAVLLKHGEGMEYSEMARVTGASESALKMRVKRGCDALRAHMMMQEGKR